jgi:hypothetical protein
VRTDLQQQDLSIPGREMVQARVDIGSEAPLVKHTHPGEKIIYVLQGSPECQIEGQPQPHLLPRRRQGGHFAVWEERDLFAAELREAFRPLR